MASCVTCWKTVPMFLIVLTICEVNSASVASERDARNVTTSERASNRLENSRSFLHSSPNSLIAESNEFTLETGKKVSQRLVGGHVRFETTTGSLFDRGEKDGDENDGDYNDEATWDDGLIISSAGNGKEKNGKQDDDDEKKTLSQQVKEGKYGLIQNELYSSRPKRPGIISYLSNPEVPKDNAKNLGGLDEEEIWLAENHVLVLRGGTFPDHEKDHGIGSGSGDDWSPIDDYKAPTRQVKIPSRPKIPPPFPVQLSDNGPVQIIGVNGTSENERSSNDTRKNEAFLPDERASFALSKNGTVTPKSVTDQESTTRKLREGDRDVKTKTGHVPPRNGVIGPFYPSLPPGAVFVVPPSNQSDYDEDDQSIYYPPPYSFYYKQDNSTPVPPGPLVPGIILPPPPDFFGSLTEKKPATKNYPTKYTKRPVTTPKPRVVPTYYPPRKSSGKPYKNTTASSVGKLTTTKHTSRGTSFTMKPITGIKYKTTTGRTNIKPIRGKEKNTLPFVETTTPYVDGASSLEISEVHTTRPETIANSAVARTTTSTKNKWIPSVSSKPVPLVTYYSSSTPSGIDEPVEATPAIINNVITTGKHRGTSNRASYYFYEEANDDVTIGTTPNPTVYYRATTESPYYRIQELPEQKKRHDDEKKSYYEAQVGATRQASKDYGLELLEPVSKTSSRYQFTNSLPATNSVSSSGSKGQRMLTESPRSYYEDITERGHLQSYYTTTKPRSFSHESPKDNRYDYDRTAKPKPIYQYSYEAADYYKREQQQDYYKPESQQQSYYKEDTQRPTQRPETFDEWREFRDESEQYDYDGSVTLPEQERDNHRYRNRLPVSYQTTTGRPIIDTTANPQHAYYTRQEEQLLDDVTKEYFTNFGKKLRGERLPNTTPIYGKTRIVTVRPDYTEVESYGSNDYGNERQEGVYKTPRVRVHYGDQPERPYSYEGDTDVNYKNPLPSINPESEWLPGYKAKQPAKVSPDNYRQHHTQIDDREYVERNLPAQGLSSMRSYGEQRIIERTNGSPTNFVPLGDSREEERRTYSTRPVSLEGDIEVNYRNPRPPVNPDAEYIDPLTIRNNNNNANDNNPEKASYFAYRLPGDSGHFYFLTPQAISQRQDDNGGYLYTRPRATRFSRQRRRGPRNP